MSAHCISDQILTYQVKQYELEDVVHDGSDYALHVVQRLAQFVVQWLFDHCWLIVRDQFFHGRFQFSGNQVFTTCAAAPCRKIVDFDIQLITSTVFYSAWL